MSKIKRVILYKHGVGHFEREAEVTGDAEIRLAFRTEEMNDVLKSLTVYDHGGGSVSSVSYDNKKPISKLLADISLDLPSSGGNVSLLSSLRGAEVSVATGSRNVVGQVVGVDQRVSTGQNGDSGQKFYLTVFDDKGRLQTFDLDEVTSVAFLDEALQNDMRFLFSTVFSAKKQDAKALKVFSRGDGDRLVSLSYVVECPVWKTSYRIAVGDEERSERCYLQGWALVDNPQDEDWKDVALSLVSGLPISFRHDLYSPRYLQRKEIEVKREAAAGPVMTEGDFADPFLAAECFEPQMEMAAPPMPAAAAPVRMMAMSPRGGGGAIGGVRALEKSAAKVETIAQKAGQLFEYKIDRPVTVLRNQSALVPIVSSSFEGGKKLLYKETDRAENPFSVVEFKNTTGLTLEGGPVTIYEGDIYAGEAMMDTLSPGEERMLPYAVALDVEVKVERESRQARVEQRINQGTWREKQAFYSTTRYRFANRSGKAQKVIVEHPISQDELVNTPKPLSETRNFWRFGVDLPVEGGETLEITEKRVHTEFLTISHTEPYQILARIKSLDAELGGLPLFDELSKLFQQYSKLQSRISELTAEIQERENGQMRIRENLKSLGSTEEERALRARYVSQLDTDETTLEKLKNELTQTRAAWQKAREDFYAKAAELSLERVFE